MFDWLKNNLTADFFIKAGTVIAAVLLMFILYKVIRSLMKKTVCNKVKPQIAMLIEKAIKYTFVVLVTLYILDLFGIKLSALLGAAGIAGIAVGFAAQTSVSNIISGFFMLSEQTFKIGDFITIDGVSGTVDSIDLLSIKLHTPDNQIVRIPNEAVIQSKLVNASYNPNRRFCLSVGLPYDCNLEEIEKLLIKIASETECVLAEPSPVVLYDSFADSSVNVLLAAWCKKEDFLAMKSNLFKNVHRELAKANVIIPFPQLDIHFDEGTPLSKKENNLQGLLGKSSAITERVN